MNKLAKKAGIKKIKDLEISIRRLKKKSVAKSKNNSFRNQLNI